MMAPTAAVNASSVDGNGGRALTGRTVFVSSGTAETPTGAAMSHLSRRGQSGSLRLLDGVLLAYGMSGEDGDCKSRALDSGNAPTPPLPAPLVADCHTDCPSPSTKFSRNRIYEVVSYGVIYRGGV